LRPIPIPEPGLVISYAYLWRYEHEAGIEEGQKIRPCVIVLAVQQQDSGIQVTVAPITHTPPSNNTIGVAIPPRVKQHLGLDHQTSWVILTEVNQFIWPGYDLTPIPGSKSQYAYGFLPPRFFDSIRAGLLDLVMQRRDRVTPRD
jgi:hypothetical protein